MENPEPRLLEARAKGEISCDAAFERFHAHYASVIQAWLRVRAAPEAVDDLSQDVWTVFYNRWRRWQFLPEMEAPEARPVLAFLMRTCRLTLMGHQRRRALTSHQTLEDVDVADRASDPERGVELGRLLSLARRLLPAPELDILVSKLAGVRAKDIARNLRTTEAVVDHGFRNAVKRLKDMLQGESGRGLP